MVHKCKFVGPKLDVQGEEFKNRKCLLRGLIGFELEVRIIKLFEKDCCFQSLMSSTRKCRKNRLKMFDLKTKVVI